MIHVGTTKAGSRKTDLADLANSIIPDIEFYIDAFKLKRNLK
jgi:hypothetical protein